MCETILSLLCYSPDTFIPVILDGVTSVVVPAGMRIGRLSIVNAEDCLPVLSIEGGDPVYVACRHGCGRVAVAGPFLTPLLTQNTFRALVHSSSGVVCGLGLDAEIEEAVNSSVSALDCYSYVSIEEDALASTNCSAYVVSSLVDYSPESDAFILEQVAAGAGLCIVSFRASRTRPWGDDIGREIGVRIRRAPLQTTTQLNVTQPSFPDPTCCIADEVAVVNFGTDPVFALSIISNNTYGILNDQYFGDVVAAATFYGAGRVVVIGSSVLSGLSLEDTAHFVRNVFGWLFPLCCPNNTGPLYYAGAAGTGELYQNILDELVASENLQVSEAVEADDLKDVQVLGVTLPYARRRGFPNSQIYKFVADGGGLIVLPRMNRPIRPKHINRINKFLDDFGIQFTGKMVMASAQSPCPPS